VRKQLKTQEAPADLVGRTLRSGNPAVVLLSFTPTRESLLTDAERDVAIAVARGLSNAEIALARDTSPRTVANQVAVIMSKLHVSSRFELAAQLHIANFI